MNLNKSIYAFYAHFNNEEMKEVNVLYFESLYKQFREKDTFDMVLFDGKNTSLLIPFPLLNDEDEGLVPVQDYEELTSEVSTKLKEKGLCICKMQAGLGTSVERIDLVKKYTSRETLGAKGTDLFIKYNNRMLSIAEVQILKAEEKKDEGVFKFVSYLNLLNSETQEAVLAIWNHEHPEKKLTYNELFLTEKLKRKEEIYQLMMPTINKDDGITFERVAPAGHGFLGFYELLMIFRKQIIDDEILVVGNGEDLKSTPDNKILSWVAEKNIPIVMITTTKLEKDKKGGQLALAKCENPYVCIIEKAQAQKAHQLEFFENLGLGEKSKRSLFNTNIVIINKKALKKCFDKYLDVNERLFIEMISPDIIKNIKEQNGEKFIQLEGAIGSTMLNLDKFFRQNFNVKLISFLNLDAENREKFFMPIKKRSDFDEIYSEEL